MLIPALAPDAATSVVIASVAAALDGVDGWIARRTRTASAFGARFDMETDALLILVLSALVWRSGKAGAWVLASGLMRYAFVAAATIWPWMQEPLEPSRRRQAVCVVQVVASSRRPAAVARRAGGQRRGRSGARGARLVFPGGYPVVVAIARLAAALLILNASLTFQSLWPTPAVRWEGELSIELAAGLLIAIAATLVGASPTSRRAIRWLTIVWLVFVLGRYGDVTAQALYGRDINLYWDLRFIPDVASMLARAAPWWLIVAAVAGTALVIALLYVVIRWAIARVVEAIQAPAARGVLGAAAIAIAALFAVEYPQNLDAHERWFPTPVTTTVLPAGAADRRRAARRPLGTRPARR